MLSDPRPLNLVAADALPPMIAPTRTALVIIDAQVDFISPNGALGQAGLDMTAFEAPLQRIEALIEAARHAGTTVVLVRVITRPETDSTALKLLAARKGEPPDSIAICRAGTPGADYYRLRPEAGDLQIEKILFSSFHGTDFDAQLRARGIDTLVVAGFTTECCVDCTVRDAFHHGYNLFVVPDACAAYEDELHSGAIYALSQTCALLAATDAIITAWA